jgi:hypothetical protein
MLTGHVEPEGGDSSSLEVNQFLSVHRVEFRPALSGFLIMTASKHSFLSHCQTIVRRDAHSAIPGKKSRA